MDDLIEALQIIRKYMKEDVEYPTNCSHDELAICINGIFELLSDIDRTRLQELGFEHAADDDYFYSFRFGSC